MRRTYALSDCIHASDGQLNEQIELLRKELNTKADELGYLHHDVITLSQELDILIVESYRRQKSIY